MLKTALKNWCSHGPWNNTQEKFPAQNDMINLD